MSYKYSNTDRANFRWIDNDHSVATLIQIKLKQGQMRGLDPLTLEFKYPISVIAGENGTGKSTLLAIAACGYHNGKDGYLPTGRKIPYYTFSDFFIQSKGEIPPTGIQINYQILHNFWRSGKTGPGWQSRRKRIGGKWNNYDSRVNRNVVYFGVQRVVPHYERSTHKSYRAQFTNQILEEQHKRQICAIAGRILGKTYETFEKHTYSKYSLPITQSGNVRYSGFNMGAGEIAIFEILMALFEAGRGAFLVIDELELGLHERAQIRFVQELKELCREYHCQVICSTHSHVVLDAVPPEGRFFLEVSTGRTIVSNGITAGYACGLLRGAAGNELDILVEDELAETIVVLGVPHRLRQRITVKSIGSSNAVIRGMATRYLEGVDDCICVLDGDKRNDNNQNHSLFRRYTENKYRCSEEEMTSWMRQRLCYLPSENTPEVWLLDACSRIEDKTLLSNTWSVNDQGIIGTWLDSAMREQAHSEIFAISQATHLAEERVVADLIRFLLSVKPEILSDVIQQIDNSLVE